MCNIYLIFPPRNFLTEEEFTQAAARDPNYAGTARVRLNQIILLSLRCLGYVDADFLLNPTSPLSETIILNELNSVINMLKGIPISQIVQ